jgi:hypothetical protein
MEHNLSSRPKPVRWQGSGSIERFSEEIKIEECYGKIIPGIVIKRI